MTGSFGYRYFWSIYIIALTRESVFSYNTSTTLNEFNSQDSTSIFLNKCCWRIPTLTHHQDYNNCTSQLHITWDALKLYRVSRSTKAEAERMPDLMKVDNVLQDSLRCKNSLESILQISVPTSEETEIQASSKDFFTFFYQDGYFQYNGLTFSPKEYCVESILAESIVIVSCDYMFHCSETNYENSTNTKPCLYRCCDYGEVWDISGPGLRCANSGIHKWKPPQYFDLSSDKILVPERDENENEHVLISSHPRNLRKVCKNMYTFQISNPEIHKNEKLKQKFGQRSFKVLANGTVWISIRKREWVQLFPGEYCVDGFQIGEGNYTGNDITDSLLFECKDLETPQELENQKRQRKLSLSFGIIIIFCLLFLLMTTVVYILLWSKHNIHGWTVFSYITTLLVTYLLLGASHFSSVFMVRNGTQGKLVLLTYCGVLGILCHFAFLCTFSWSTVLSFDLFCTFRTLRPRRSGKSTGLKKFLMYCFFAFMVPAVIVTAGIFLDINYSTDEDVITPEYGKSVCYVEPRYAKFYFVILPIAVFLGINLALFCNTAYSVYKVKKSTQFASSSSTKAEKTNETLRLILKLLLVNGAVWVVEIISWYFQTDYDEVGVLSFILDVVNIMQAVAIFFLFVFKNDILESLRRKYPCLESTIDAAFRLKKVGTIQRSREYVATASTDTACNVKVKAKENMSTEQNNISAL